MLIYPDFSKEFIIQSDASGNAIGFVLGQEIDKLLRPIKFGGRSLRSSERNYSTTDRIMLIMQLRAQKYMSLDMYLYCMWITSHYCTLGTLKTLYDADITGFHT